MGKFSAIDFRTREPLVKSMPHPLMISSDFSLSLPLFCTATRSTVLLVNMLPPVLT
jgi:hypothetical protein